MQVVILTASKNNRVNYIKYNSSSFNLFIRSCAYHTRMFIYVKNYLGEGDRRNIKRKRGGEYVQI